MPSEVIHLTVKIDVQLGFWQALKLRLAGVEFLEAYIRETMKHRFPGQED